MNAAPVTDFVPAEYPLCDNDQTGAENFDFDGFITIPAGITLTYYNSEPDANTDTNPITTATTPPSNDYPSTGGETIWVRAVNLDGCVTVSSFELVIDTVPDYTPIPLFQVCDDSNPDGQTDFDLDSQNIDIATVGGIFNPDLTVTYHLTEADAEAGTIPSLSSPFNNTNPFSQIIWVRVEDDITGCYGDFQMELNVISPIAGTPTPLVECDEVPNDGLADFDLLDPILLGEIINGQTDMAVTFHLESVRGRCWNSYLAKYIQWNYSNHICKTTITIPGFEDCYDTIALDLIVNAAPVTDFVPAEYPLCDNDQTGAENFDFDGFITIPAGITLTYYNSEPDANTDTNPITTATTPPSNDYPSTGGETIWVRAVNLDGCVTVSSFELVIDTVPDYTPIPLFQVCDDSNPDGQTDFDLDSQNIDIATVGGIFNPDLTVTYHLTEADAEAGTIPSLSSPFNNTNPFSQIIWVRVEDDITGCYGDFQMELNVISPIAGTPTPLVECDRST